MLLATSTLLALALGASLAATAVQAAPDPWSGDGGVSAFYRWTGEAPRAPGRMLRTEPAPAGLAVPAAGGAERILYSSTDWLDPQRLVAVSGVVFFPKGAAPAGGWPVIAWAHGTTGVADVCAPSFLPRSDRDEAYLGAWLEAGYAIVATDYVGLGTPGPHPYLQPRSEGLAVLDAARAALAAYPDKLANRVVAMGQSQGAGAAIAAARLAPSYSPDLNIKGAVATGLVANTKALNGAPQAPVANLYTERDGARNSAYEMLYFLGTARSVAPTEIRPEDYIAPAAWPLLEKAQSTCMGGLTDFAGELGVPVGKLYSRPIDALEQRVQALADFPDVIVRTPVFVGTGLADADAQPASQYNFVSAMCAAGDVVEHRYYPHATHGGAVMRSLVHSRGFVDKVMADRPVENSCPALAAPGPLQDPED